MSNSNTTNSSSNQGIIAQTLEYNAPNSQPPPINGVVCFGTCPSGTMTTTVDSDGFLSIEYCIPGDFQKSYHPRPGSFHAGIQRSAYLPDTSDGRDILLRFQYAFLHGLCFALGRSLTTGCDNVVTWSPILPHKSSKHPGQFGYPDVGYLPSARLALDSLQVPRDLVKVRQFVVQSLGVAFVSATAAASSSAASSTAAASSTPAPVTPPTPVPFSPSGPLPDETVHYTHTTTAPNLHQECFDDVDDDALDDDDDTKECAICFESLASTKAVVALKKCKHKFHKECLLEMMDAGHLKCPICRAPLGETPHGNGPSGSMTIHSNTQQFCSGFDRTVSNGILSLHYTIPCGVQTSTMENPHTPYHGTHRVAYLPWNDDGLELLARLKYAFVHGLTFRVGTSLTTGQSNTVTWTSIHHKTSPYPGAHGFPDPGYFFNCHESLTALGVPAAEDCP